MKYKKCTNDKIYGFGIVIPSKNYDYCAGRYIKIIEPFMDWTIKKIPPKNKRGLHINIKYLGYRKNYSKKHIKKLIPELKEISKKFLPLEIEVKGIKIATGKYNSIGVLLNYKSNPKIKKFHKEVMTKLKNKIDFFEYSDEKNFRHHIVIGSCPIKNQNLKTLRKLSRKSKNDKTTKIICKNIYLTDNKGIKII